MFTRFEFGGTGFFHALDIIEDLELSKPEEEDLCWAERKLNEFLKVPNIEWTMKTKSFFTPAGVTVFREALDILKELFGYAEDAGLGELSQIESDLDGEKIIYRDEYQVLIKVQE